MLEISKFKVGEVVLHRNTGKHVMIISIDPTNLFLYTVGLEALSDKIMPWNTSHEISLMCTSGKIITRAFGYDYVHASKTFDLESFYSPVAKCK